MVNASKKALYSLKILVFFNSLCCTWSFGQNLSLSLRSAGLNSFANKLICYGFQQKDGKSQFTVYQLDDKLRCIDSLSYELKQETEEGQSLCWSDSLHGFLNIYVPEGKEKGFSVFRFNRNFELIERISGIEAGRLNPLAGFDNALHYDGNFVYAIKSKRDSSGQQFFLNKFRLKEDLKTFDYYQVWQFSFERKNIRYAKVIFSNRDFVFLYVMITDGEKSGQWILRLNARNGYLLRGSKLNEKGDENSYMYGSSYYLKDQKGLLLTGHKFNTKQLPPGSEMLSTVSSTAIGLYLIELDSLGEKKNKVELKWPIQETKIAGKKNTGTYLLQFSQILEKSSGQFSVNTDVYKRIDGTSCFVYGNSLGFSFKRDDEQLVAEKKNISTNVQIDSYLYSTDKLDMNGKLCADSGITLPRLLDRKVSMQSKQFYGLDSLDRPVWVLSKSLVKRGNSQYHFLKAGKKNYELVLIEEIPKSKNPQFILKDTRSAVLARQESEYNFQIKVLRLR